MEIFLTTLQQMLTLFTLILFGYLLRKKEILPTVSDITMSRLETYIFTPAVNLSNMMAKCNVKSFTENAPLILYGAIMVFSAILMATFVSRFFAKNDGSAKDAYQRCIYKYALTFGNFGFVGYALILGVWGSEWLFKYQMLVFVPSIVAASWGLYTLIPKDQNAGLVANLKKGLLNPPIICLAIGIILGLLNIDQYVPKFLTTVFKDASACQGPVAMVLAGFVIGGYNMKKMLANKKVYVATFLRLIVIPSVVMFILMALNTPKDIMTIALVYFATPLGLNTIVYPAAYGGETQTGASMASISHTLSVITIPLMYLVYIVWL